MRKLNITKKQTGFFKDKKNHAFSKATGWPLLLLLLLILIVGSAYTTARNKSGGHPEDRVKVKPVTGKPRRLALPPSPPTISYPGPYTYGEGQTISLAPTNSGVAAFSYSTTAIPYGSGFNMPLGVATDIAGNLYIADYNNGIIKIPPGNGSPVYLTPSVYNIYGPYKIATDIAGNLYIATSEPDYNEIGGFDGYSGNTIWKLPAGSNTPIGIEGGTFESDAGIPITPFALTTDHSGDLFIAKFDGYDNTDVNGLYNLEELPAGSSSIHVVFPDYMNVYSIASNAAGNLFVSNYPGGIEEMPIGGGAPVPIPGPYRNAGVISLDAAGNLYAIDYASGSPPHLTMSAAGNLYESQVVIGPNLNNPTDFAIDGTGNIYVSSYNYSTEVGSVTKIKPTGGYFIAPALPAGLFFDNNTGIISGRATAASPLTTYTITAYNGSGSTTATVSLRILQGSNDAELTHLIPTRGVFTPAFTASTTSYTATVDNGVKSFQLTPITASPYAGVKINGVAVADSAISAPLPLALGANIFNIVVTAPDAITTKTYTLTLNRATSNNADLVSLTRSTGVLSPVFTAATTNYTINVVNGVRSMTVTPTASDPEATINVNGTTVSSGTASAPIALAVGANTISIAVTASDGVTIKIYTITVNRPAASLDNLSSLTLSAGALSPDFSSTTTGYTVNVANSVRSTTVTPTVVDPDATIKVNGTTVASGTASAAIALPLGASTINIAVTASDGTTTKTYVITVNRPKSNNDNLSSLRISAGLLIQGITANDYTVSVSNNITSMKVTPTAADAEATIAVNGASVPSGSASGPIALSVGTTTINIVVTASDGITSQTYTLTVTRWPPFANDDLKAIFLSVGYLSPVFDPTTTSYTIAEMNSTAGVDVRALAADSTSTVVANGRSPTPGGDFFFQLALGSNTINVVVTSADGTASKTYTLNIIRPGSNNANLASLKISRGTLSPAFTTANTSYTASVANGVTSVMITPTTYSAGATVTVNGTAVPSGSASNPIALSVSSNTINTIVTAQDGTTTNTYTIVVTRAAGPINIPDASLSVSQQPTSPPIEDDVIIVHQGISPNGDGINDFLVIDGILAYPDNKLSIMNRNGQLIFEAKGYDNSSKIFDGHSNKTGQMQLPGTYFYSLEYTVKGVTKHKTGFLVLKY